MAFSQKNSVHPHNNHIWIEIRDQRLFDLLRPHFQGFSTFTGMVPGIDARHIYMQREHLKQLIPQPAELQALPSPNKTIYNDLVKLLEYIEQEFADVTREMEYMNTDKEDPRIKWDLLWALLTPGELLETTETVSGLDMAFKPRTWLYADNDNENSSSSSEPCFIVRGEFLQWTGYEYSQIHFKRTIKKYTGTESIHTLAFKRLTSARKASFMGKYPSGSEKWY
ncbi:unnamed protein product [Rhizoctonia solani]|uniref:DUF7025 domain-containing protein n=1 Tax=Rhizoctonia solani TaxID=456999 RepID=A0A8H3HA02_9AGAM|nr:unnamed protein product [Rhizoctonia solani]